METKWLADFIVLARTASFTRAAAERHLTQSAFSRRIKALETWAGATLVDRSGYPVRLTAAGEAFLPEARALLDGLLRCRDDLRAVEGGGHAVHAFAAPHSISATHLAHCLDELHRRLPTLVTRVRSDDLHSCCQLLIQGSCDFLVCFRHPAVPLALEPADFERLDLGHEELLPVCAPAAPGRPIWDLERDPVGVPWLAYSEGAFLGAVVESLLGDRRQQLELRHLDAFVQGLAALARRSLGVAWLPRSAVARDLDGGTLLAAGGEDWRASLAVSVYAAHGPREDGAAAVWECLAAIAGAHGLAGDRWQSWR